MLESQSITVSDVGYAYQEDMKKAWLPLGYCDSCAKGFWGVLWPWVLRKGCKLVSQDPPKHLYAASRH
ncbi:hypothetical protein KEM48_006636 [Puccinia striiformis f. sp. tritici PST-130]|nr:hypothetical protein KEM48_006636 [Puccinia striiformis f. sp. tritici PST-130]